MVLCGCHRFPQCFAILEVTHQNAQAVQVRVLWGDYLKNGLSNDHTKPNECACGGTIHTCNIYFHFSFNPLKKEKLNFVVFLSYFVMKFCQFLIYFFLNPFSFHLASVWLRGFLHFLEFPFNNIQQNGLHFLHSTFGFMLGGKSKAVMEFFKINNVQRTSPWHKILWLQCILVFRGRCWWRKTASLVSFDKFLPSF